MRSINVAPDLSSSSARVSEIVSTAIFSGTNCLLLSIPWCILTHKLVLARKRRASAKRPRDAASFWSRHSTISKLRGGEGVAACDRTGAEAGIEPALALLGASMRERVRNHVAARASLQRVIADRGGGTQRGLDVARFDECGLPLVL